MVVSISFIETPLKFRAPGMTIQLGLAIGRLVFRALNAVECVLAVALLAVLVAGGESSRVMVAVVVAVVCLIVQLLVVRPVMSRRTTAIRDGAVYSGRSRIHLAYVAAEGVKAAALITAVVLAVVGGH
ncbi:hypothetical protein FZI91_00055 [Mycobacterium sp. CBMA271]|nr:hypothetical protein [Mycobacteroides sp. CBMA 326]MUM20099.1 hypothetical protein [Mycobacteroides sp. CBMA 271]